MFQESSIQLGKKGVTEDFIITLKGHFENHQQVKISVLKNARKNKEDVKMHAEKILERMGKRYTYKTIGFTIILRKWRKEVR
ncbi:MAG: YhbY family RNA-binding protein [Candidatus Pacearchaeota archaeon]